VPGHTPYTRPVSYTAQFRITDTDSVYCAVQKECQVNLNLYSCAMAPAASRRPLTAEARVRSPFSPCEICSGEWQWGRYFLGSLVGPVFIIPPMSHTQLHLHAALTTKVKRAKHADHPTDNIISRVNVSQLSVSILIRVHNQGHKTTKPKRTKLEINTPLCLVRDMKPCAAVHL
jgi:hypothetical protein